MIKRLSALTTLFFLSLTTVVYGQERTHITTGAALPANCTIGDVFFQTNGPAGLYVCTALDTFVLVDLISSSTTLTNKTLTSPVLTTPTVNGAIVFEDGTRQTFNPNGTNSGLNVGAHTADPSSPTNGDIFYDSDDNLLRARIGGTWVSLGAGGGGGLASTDIDTSAEIAAIVGNETGTNLLVFNTSPTLVTPTLGVATATSINGLTITSSTGTLTVTNGKTLAVSNSLTFTGTDSTAFAFPSGSDTVVTLTASQTLTNKTLAVPSIATPTITGAVSFEDGVRQTFNPSSTVPGFNFGANATDPSTPANGDAFYDSDDHLLRVRINGAWVTVGAASAGCTVAGSDTQVLFNDGGSCGADAGLVFNKTSNALTITGVMTAAAYSEGVAAKTSSATLSALESFVTCDSSGGAVTLTLPSASGITGRAYTVKKIDSSSTACVVEGSGAETVDGEANQSVVRENDAITVVSDGTNFVIKSTASSGVADPDADGIFVWDDSINAYVLAAIGTGLSFDGTTLTSSGGAGLVAADIDTSAEIAAIVGNETGSSLLVFNTSPTLVTPTLGAATATTINGLTLTASTGTFTLTNGKTLAVTNTLTLSGTDSTVMTFPGASGTVLTADSTATMTNKTYDAEGTGNLLTLPMWTMWPLAVCQGATATLGMSHKASLAPTAACMGTEVKVGIVTFPDSDGEFELQGNLPLAPDFTGTLDVRGKWRTAATSGDIVIQLQWVCVGDAEVTSDTWSAASTTTETAKGTTLQWNDWAITGVSITGCAAGEDLAFRVFRQRTHGSDSLTGTFDMKPFGTMLRRGI